MKQTVRSFGHAWEGIVHALTYEKNLRRFVLGHSLLLCLGILFRVEVFFLIVASLMAGFFIVTELMNTAIERVTDTFDDHLKTARGGHEHPGVKMAKDVSSAASLVALTMYGITILLLLAMHMYLVITGL